MGMGSRPRLRGGMPSRERRGVSPSEILEYGGGSMTTTEMETIRKELSGDQ